MGLAGVKLERLRGEVRRVKSLLNEFPKANCWSYICVPRSIVHLTLLENSTMCQL